MTSTTTHRGIVVGIDGSATSELAVKWAARDAAMHNVPLTLIHVLPSPAVMAWPDLPLPPAFLDWPEAEGRNIIRDAAKLAEDAAGAPIQIDSDMVIGPAIAALTDLSKEARMIVVGCRGRGLLARLLGSVSSGLTHHAHCPVAIIHDDDAQGPDHAVGPVVVGIDGSPASEKATAIAFDEASRRGADVVAVHACFDWTGWEYPDFSLFDVEQLGSEVLAERLAGYQEQYPDVNVRRVVAVNQAAKQIIDEAKDAQLIVVGSHGRGGFSGMLLGSVSSAVAQSARVPVIVARTS